MLEQNLSLILTQISRGHQQSIVLQCYAPAALREQSQQALDNPRKFNLLVAIQVFIKHHADSTN